MLCSYGEGTYLTLPTSPSLLGKWVSEIRRSTTTIYVPPTALHFYHPDGNSGTLGRYCVHLSLRMRSMGDVKCGLFISTFPNLSFLKIQANWKREIYLLGTYMYLDTYVHTLVPDPTTYLFKSTVVPYLIANITTGTQSKDTGRDFPARYGIFS